jgi:protein-S-isoprenylcysteine O-methyltransferase Ste14
MRATAIEFRLRMVIMAVVITLGFWSPWIETWGLGKRISLLEWLALELSRLGLIPFAIATPLVIVVAALAAAAGAILRVWGTAWLGPGTVNNMRMIAGTVLADGPYRYMRNPLYIGSGCMVAAMAFLMPPTGALFVMALLTVFLIRLIHGEEAFLTAQLGDPYRAYLQAVPRLIPRLRTTLQPTGRRPHWLHAVLAETNPIGVFLIFAVLSWRYDHWLMVRAIIVSFGVSLVVRAVDYSAERDAGPIDNPRPAE